MRARREDVVDGGQGAPSGVVFACPTCLADRLGTIGRGAPHAPGTSDGAHLRCMVCDGVANPRRARRRVGARHRHDRMVAATSAIAAAAIREAAAAPRDRTDVDRTTVAGVELVLGCTTLRELERSTLRRLAADPALDDRLRGDVAVVGTGLTIEGAASLLGRVEAVLEAGGPMGPRQRVLRDHVARLLSARAIWSQ